MKKEHAMKNINKRERKNFSIVFTIALVFLLTAAIIPSVMGASTVDLGSACNFVILAKSGITNVPTSAITGDIGTSPITGAAITGLDDCSQVNGTIYTVNAAGPACRVVDPVLLTAAVGDMETAYTDAAGRAPGVTELGAGNIGGMTIAPGVYKWSSGVTIPTNVTLSGGPNDVWIFEIAQTLDIASGKQVILSGGAQPKNIFWQVAGVTTLGTYSTFNGNILGSPTAGYPIAIKTGATLNGRALAQDAVTLDTTTVNGPTTCAIPMESIELIPATATNTLGETHTVTATVKDANGNPVVGKPVTFAVTVGPNLGATVTGVTDSIGKVTFSYVGNVVGTDTIIASFVDNAGITIQSNEVTKKWEQGTPVPEFPTVAVPVVMLIGIVFIFHSIRRKE